MLARIRIGALVKKSDLKPARRFERMIFTVKILEIKKEKILYYLKEGAKAVALLIVLGRRGVSDAPMSITLNEQRQKPPTKKPCSASPIVKSVDSSDPEETLEAIRAIHEAIDGMYSDSYKVQTAEKIYKLGKATSNEKVKSAASKTLADIADAVYSDRYKSVLLQQAADVLL